MTLNEQQTLDKVKDVEAHSNDKISNKKKKKNKNPWSINKNVHMPMDSEKEGITVEEENNDDNKEISCDHCSVKKSAMGENNDINYDECLDTSRMDDMNMIESNQCPFEMIDNIANAMKKLENVAIAYCSESDKSEKLRERQQQTLKIFVWALARSKDFSYQRWYVLTKFLRKHVENRDFYLHQCPISLSSNFTVF